jgi:hypothetical protein
MLKPGFNEFLVAHHDSRLLPVLVSKSAMFSHLISLKPALLSANARILSTKPG